MPPAEVGSIEAETDSIRLKEVFTPVISTLILLGLMWVGDTVNANSVNISLMQKDIGYINLKLAEFKSATRDRFTGAQAKESFGVRDKQIESIASRVRDIENTQ